MGERRSMNGIPYGGMCAQTDPESFFPESKPLDSTRRVCDEVCEVKDECLQGALEREEKHGIWGGLSTNERDRLLGKIAV